VYRNVRAPFECRVAVDPTVDGSVAGLTEWLTSHPGLQTSDPQPVTIGGLDGVVLDLRMRPGWDETCRWARDFGSIPVVPFLMGGDPSSFHKTLWGENDERLYLFDLEGGNVAISVSAELAPPANGPRLADYEDAVTSIIESFRFAT
jgi:hypothetical protein